MTADGDKWRREHAMRRLCAPVTKRRTTGTLTGKVEDCFDGIMNARSRGMSWAQIAEALGGEGALNVESVESAFRRICVERGAPAPGRGGQANKSIGPSAAAPVVTKPGKTIKPQPVEQDGLFDQERWVDKGDD